MARKRSIFSRSTREPAATPAGDSGVVTVVRARRAGRALGGYLEAGARAGLDVDQRRSEGITDLLADLMHLCEAADMPFDAHLARARTHYEIEAEEQDDGTSRHKARHAA
ncbi:MAG: hypothetical protein ACR2NA_00505 [Solirubrobacterales bacterium]